jgi:4-aminobutyrate aminotransferase-like enzyme
LHTEKVVRIAPPLVITDEEITFALSVMEEALQAVS